MRHLIALTLLACAGLAPMAAAETASPTPACERLGWKIALQAWTAHHTTLWETMDLAKAAGIGYLELYPGQVLGGGMEGKFDHNSPPEIRAKVLDRLQELGLKAVAYGVVSLPKDPAQCRKVFEFAKAFGMITINSEPGADAFATIEDLVKEFNIRVGLHNHPKPSRYWDPATVLQTIDQRDPRIGACADTGHWPRSGMPAIDAVKKLAGHIESSHFKDTDIIGTGAKDVVYGTGVNGVAALLAEYQRQQFTGPISIEYEANRKGPELLGDLKAMVAFLETTAGKL